MSSHPVLVTGSLAFDNIMSMPARFRDHILPDKIHILNVSFLMDTLRKEFGGTGGNQAYTLSLLGLRPTLVAAVGKDFAGYKLHLRSAGVDLRGVRVFRSELTATGFVVADQDDNQIWGFYGGAMRLARTLSLRSFVGGAPFVVIAPNDPEAMVRYVGECRQRGVPYLYDPAFYIPRISVSNLRKGILGARIVIGNDYEIALLGRRTGVKEEELLHGGRILVTTLGAKGSIIQKNGEEHRIPSAKPQRTSDPTGAGDAYRAGFLAGFLRGLPLPVCGRMGSTAAAYTVEKYGTQTHRFTLRQFERRYRENFGSQLSL